MWIKPDRFDKIIGEYLSNHNILDFDKITIHSYKETDTGLIVNYEIVKDEQVSVGRVVLYE